MGLPRRDGDLHTYGDYLTWSDDARYELIDGVAYLMSPGPSRVHQEIVGELFRQIGNALEGRPCRAYVATAAHDQTVKLAAYERAGVREVWFVHPTDQVVTVYEHVGGRFARPAITEMRARRARPCCRRCRSTGRASWRIRLRDEVSLVATRASVAAARPLG